MAKNFDTANIKTGRVYSELEQATGAANQQDTASPEEVKTRRSKLKTQGRKGAKAIRINMAFTPENHRFIRVYASSTGQTMTEACNQMLDYARRDPRFLQEARAGIDALWNDVQAEAAGGATDEAGENADE